MRVWKETEHFHQYNANPKNRNTSDCVIRALTVITGKDWDTIFDELVPYAHKHKCLINNDSAYENYLKDIGYVKVKQPKHSDNTKFTGVELVDFIRNYRFIKPVMLSIGPHHVSVISGYTERTENGEYKEKESRILDTANISLRKVGKVWVHESDAERWKSIMSKCRCGFYE